MDVLKNEFKDTIAQLITAEEGINKSTLLRADVDQILQHLGLTSVGKRSTTTCNSGGGGSPRKKQRTDNGNGNGNKTACQHCGKYHLGRCRKLDNPNYNASQTGGGGGANNKKSGLTKKKWEEVQMTILEEEGIGEDNTRSSLSSNSGWKRGIVDSVEQM